MLCVDSVDSRLAGEAEHPPAGFGILTADLTRTHR
jgi:hypothetical protein